MRARAFRFPCAYLNAPEHTDPEFDRFEAAGLPYCNPFPQLADPSNLRKAWSQPLVRAFYQPTTRFGELNDDWPHSLDLNQRVALHHEHQHMSLDFTPAKELARVLLARIYQMLLSLPRITGPAWDYRAVAWWDSFERLHDTLVDTAERIALAEELIASVFSFDDLKILLASDQARLDEFEKSVLQQQADSIDANFPREGRESLGDLYCKWYKSFQKLAGLTQSSSDLSYITVRARLSIYLEAVHIDRGIPAALDSRVRCEKLSNAVENMHSGDQLVTWLEHEGRAPDDVNGWLSVLETQMDLCRSSRLMNVLWAAARGQELSRRRTKVTGPIIQARYWDWTWTGFAEKGWWPYLRIVPEEEEGRWHLNARGFSGPPWDSKQRRLYQQLFLLESLRQQLDAGTGIQCSMMRGTGACSCASGWPLGREIISRLTRWARDGRLRVPFITPLWRAGG